ncbi:hypothetical protein NE237_024976 [Protea cynaroides]|uniref:Uncharacterized protein n=1 Tax=Protea cynaroides TaxID=273540 RepID=A0A9Q0H4C7_9MAGN|nr:hypothetical protein NE237_024976 [Protea cynaroides]
MKVEAVIKVRMNDAKSRAKAMQIVVGIQGVEAVSLQGEDKDQLLVKEEKASDLLRRSTTMTKKKIVIKISMNGKKTFPKRILNRLPQKMVINISMNRVFLFIFGKNMNRLILQPIAPNIAVRQPGVESVAFQGEEKDQLVVVGGEDTDPVVLTRLLRKTMGRAELIAVGPPDEKKKEEKKEEKKETKSEVVMQPINRPTIYQGVPPYYTVEALNYNRQPLCTIM